MQRALYPATSYGLQRVYCEFELLGAGAAALTIPVAGGGQVSVASIARSAPGTFVVTMKDTFNKVLFKGAELDDTLGDGSYATCGNVTNEGTALPIVFTIYTRSAAGALTDPAVGRRVGVNMAFRNCLPNQGG